MVGTDKAKEITITALKDIVLFRNNLQKFIREAKGDNNTLVSMKAGDVFALLALSEKHLSFKGPGWTPPLKEPWAPKEPTSRDTPYVNQVLSRKD